MADYKVGVVIGAALAGGYRSTVGSAKSELDTLGKAIKDLSAQRGLIEQFEKDQAAVEKARLSFSAAQKEVMRLKLELKKGTGDATAKDLEKAQAKAEKLNAALEKTREKIRKTEQAMDKAGVETSDFANHYTKLGATLDQTRLKYEKLESRMAAKSAAGQKLFEMKGEMLGMAGAVYAADKILGQSADFETSGVRLATVINTKDVEKGVAESKKHALDFARKNLTSENETLDIEYSLDSAGLDAQASRIGSEIVSKVSTITRGSAEGVGEVIATVFNNLGGSLEGNTQQRLTRIGELLTKTQFKFQIRDFNQLGESMKYGASVLKQYNVDLTQGVSVIGMLNSAGLQGSQAGTAFAATMRNISKASREFGFEIARNAQGGIDVVKTLQNMSDAVGGLSNMDQDLADKMQQVFGEEGIRMVALLGDNLKGLADAQKDVADTSKGIIDTSYHRFLDSTNGKLTIAGNNLRIVGTVFMGALLPAVNAVLTPAAGFMGWIGELIEKAPGVVVAIGGAVGALLAVKTAMIIGTAAVWLFNAALLANPITWVAVAVGAAVALIVNYWKPITGFFGKLWAGIKSVFKEGIAWITNIWNEGPVGKMLEIGGKIGAWVGKKVMGAGKALGTAALGASLAVAPAAAGMPDMAAKVNEMKPAVSSSATSTQIHAPITINAAPGMNEREVARHVVTELDKRESQAKARQRGALHD